MNISYRSQPELVQYAIAGMICILLVQRYGRQAAGWILGKLYEFFIQNNPAKI